MPIVPAATHSNNQAGVPARDAKGIASKIAASKTPLLHPITNSPAVTTCCARAFNSGTAVKRTIPESTPISSKRLISN